VSVAYIEHTPMLCRLLFEYNRCTGKVNSSNKRTVQIQIVYSLDHHNTCTALV